MPVPAHPKIYHIVHVDRLPSIIKDDGLLCDAEIARRDAVGTTIGMNDLKQKRLTQRRLQTYPDLFVGACVPFYFCPRSVMLYVIWRANHPQLSYRDGQGPIIHLEADLRSTVAWAEEQDLRWAFTLSNASSNYSEDRSDLEQLGEIDWEAVSATSWQQRKEGKQAEFLVEQRFSWALVSRIGVFSEQVGRRVALALEESAHRPSVEIRREWYY